jgi:hypothetical protein
MLASLAIGPQRAATAALRGVAQLVRGALGPLSDARATLDAGLDLLAREGLLVVVAVALCKWVGFSILALPGDLAATMEASLAQSRIIAKVRAAALLVFFAMGASWLVALTAWAALSPAGSRP